MVPFPNSYWVIPGLLLAGEYPRTKDEAESRRKLEALVAAGLTRTIDLTTPADHLAAYQDLLTAASGGKARRRSLCIPDLGLPPSPDLMIEILDLIDRGLCSGEVVYVHCWGGVGRPGTVIGCWLRTLPRQPISAPMSRIGRKRTDFTMVTTLSGIGSRSPGG